MGQTSKRTTRSNSRNPGPTVNRETFNKQVTWWACVFANAVPEAGLVCTVGLRAQCPKQGWFARSACERSARLANAVPKVGSVRRLTALAPVHTFQH